MDNTYNGDDRKQSWIYFIIPLVVVITIGALTCTCHYLRVRHCKSVLRLDPSGMQTLERDLEALDRGGEAARGTRPNGQGRRRAPPMQTINGIATVRVDEGLDEFGEAPPPYQGHKADKSLKEEAVELQDLSDGPSRSTSRQENGQDTSLPVTEPPAYGLATAGGQSPAIPQQPPAAVLPRYG